MYRHTSSKASLLFSSSAGAFLNCRATFGALPKLELAEPVAPVAGARKVILWGTIHAKTRHWQSAANLRPCAVLAIAATPAASRSILDGAILPKMRGWAHVQLACVTCSMSADAKSCWSGFLSSQIPITNQHSLSSGECSGTKFVREHVPKLNRS